jgi:hypothetical protein
MQNSEKLLIDSATVQVILVALSKVKSVWWPSWTLTSYYFIDRIDNGVYESLAITFYLHVC